MPKQVSDDVLTSTKKEIPSVSKDNESADETTPEKNVSLSPEQEQEVLKQVKTEFTYSDNATKTKKDEWARRLKLYNNQRRDKTAVGDPLLFTTFNTVLASLYSDQLTIEFEPNQENDEEIAMNATAMAQFDYRQMEKDKIDYEWSWDACFFGRGFVLNYEFDREKMCPHPYVLDPLLCFRDPDASCVNGPKESSRFFGWVSTVTERELKGGQFKNVDKVTTNSVSAYDKASQDRKDAQNITANVAEKLTGDNKTSQLINWMTWFDDKRVFITVDSEMSNVLRYLVLEDQSQFPIDERTIYPMSHDFDGVSIPDLLEDKQRMRAKVQNLAAEEVQVGLYSHYTYDSDRIQNRSELENLEETRFIGVKGDPSGVVQEIPRAHVKSDVQWLLDLMANEAQQATASPAMQQGMLAETKRTATELDLAGKNVDTRYSLSAKVFGWSEQTFWLKWYALYEEHFVDADEKIIRTKKSNGFKWAKYKKSDFIADGTNLDVTVESTVVESMKRQVKLNSMYTLIKASAVDPTFNMRYALKYCGKMNNMTKDEINLLYPPTVDELQAEEENLLLNDSKLASVAVEDNDVEHLAIHNEAEDTPAKEAHIEAHRRSMMLKRVNPEIVPGQPMIPGSSQSMTGTGNPGAVQPQNTMPASSLPSNGSPYGQ